MVMAGLEQIKEGATKYPEKNTNYRKNIQTLAKYDIIFLILSNCRRSGRECYLGIFEGNVPGDFFFMGMAA